MKQLVADKHGHAIYCVHIDLGYRETFRKAAHALVESLEFGEAPPKPYYAEVAVASTNGMRIGVATNTLVRDAEGNTQSEQRTSLLVPAGPETLHSSDVIHIHWMRPDARSGSRGHSRREHGQGRHRSAKPKRSSAAKWRA